MKFALLCLLVCVGLAAGASIRSGWSPRLFSGRALARGFGLHAVGHRAPAPTEVLTAWITKLHDKFATAAGILSAYEDEALTNFVHEIETHFNAKPEMTTETAEGKVLSAQFVEWMAQLQAYLVHLDDIIHPMLETDPELAQIHEDIEAHFEALPKPVKKLLDFQMWLWVTMASLNEFVPSIQPLAETDEALTETIAHLGSLLENMPMLPLPPLNQLVGGKPGKPEKPHHAHDGEKQLPEPSPSPWREAKTSPCRNSEIKEWVGGLVTLMTELLHKLEEIYPENVELQALIGNIVQHIDAKPHLEVQKPEPPIELMEWIHGVTATVTALMEKLAPLIGEGAALEDIIAASIDSTDPEVQELLLKLNELFVQMPEIEIPAPLVEIGKWLYKLAEDFLQLKAIVETLPVNEDVAAIVEEIKNHMATMPIKLPGTLPAKPRTRFTRSAKSEFDAWLEDFIHTAQELVTLVQGHDAADATVLDLAHGVQELLDDAPPLHDHPDHPDHHDNEDHDHDDDDDKRITNGLLSKLKL